MFGIAEVVILPAMPLNVALAVVLFAIGYAILSFKVQRFVINQSVMRAQQAKMKHHMSEMKRLTDANQDASEHQTAYMAIMKENMNGQLKLMAFMLPMFFAVYYVGLPAVFWKVSMEFFNLVVPLGYAGLFVVTLVISGFVLLAVEKFFVSMMAKKVQGVRDTTAERSGGQ